MTAAHFSELIEPVANRLLGEPNRKLSKPPKEARWGAHGSLKVNLQAGTFFDHENNVGGGVLDLIKHKTGCDQGGALDWLRREGFLPPRESPKQTETRSRFVCAYDYLDADGTLVHQTLRYEPKTFRQRRPHPEKHGEWIWNLDGVQPVLYRLRDVINGVAAGRRIFVCEGEKDADNIAGLGLVATTNVMGAKKWRSEYNETLRGANVVLLPHNDGPGRAHVEQVAVALSGNTKSIRVLDIAEHWPDCPPKGDISDWIAAGGTADQLKALATALPEWGPSVVSDASVVSDEWPKMDESAYYGLAGDVVRAIEPYSEADPVAILTQFLGAAGSIIGRTPYHKVEGDHHHVNLYEIQVGKSAKARKGTSWGRVCSIARTADEVWYGERVRGGLSSGEGFIAEVRDPVTKWNPKDKVLETVDPGVTDKRLMIIEPEFAGVLAVAERQGNTLTTHLRQAWDGGILSKMTVSSPMRATGAHVSIIGHITVDELRARLTRTDAANGFANRFLFLLVKRSKVLPFGGDTLDDAVIANLGARLKEAVERASKLGRIGWTTAAAEAWQAVYGRLSEGKPGLLGAVIARAEAQVVRLAMLYALLDGAANIDLPHLKAALAVWEYAEASAAHIFGASLGDEVADEILRALRHSPEGMSRTAIRDLFGRNQSAGRIGGALALLASQGKARVESRETGGRPVEIWTAVEGH
jgi:hypothetical protein